MGGVEDVVLLELFSGIGGFSKGLLDAGFKFKKHYFSEIDKHAIANYKYNFKEAEYVGSVTSIRGQQLERPNIITFGSPCQDFSLAGKRAGLEGQRSSLLVEAIRIITESKPDIFIWENVKGAFSSNSGEDFWAILGAFTNIGGYRLEWQLLNTSWFLPQNRERIYLIGHLAGRSKSGVFPFREDHFRSNERPEQTSNIRTLTAGGHSGGMHSSMTLIKTLNGSDTLNTIRSGGRGSLDLKHSWDIIQVNSKNNFGNNSTKQQDRIYDTRGIMCCLSSSRTESKVNIVSRLDSNIRRLTEIECERLQGFNDNWTKFGIYNNEVREIAKTHRYKMCGNAVTVNVVKEIGERLIKLINDK